MGQRRHGGVVDVPKEVLYADFLRLLRSDGAGNVPEGPGHLLASVHVLLAHIRLRGDGGDPRADVDDHEHRLLTVPPEQVVNAEVILADEQPRRVESLGRNRRQNSDRQQYSARKAREIT
eukprot:scaffold62_cov256-Pinguiococcus_pyrenoidosus.AAC.15